MSEDAASYSISSFSNCELDVRARAVLLAFAEHKILSTDQIEVLFCGSDRSAQRVLQELRDAGLISSFEWQSSSRTRDANRHFLTPAGARLVASWRRCRVAELGAIPVDEDAAKKLMPHRAGVNRFFADLVRETLKHPGYGVEAWRDEHKLRTPFGEIQPDSFGRLLHPGSAVEFYFEYDRDTEHVKPLLDKFASYLRIASTWESLDGKPFPAVLFVVPSDDRERALLKALLKALQQWDPAYARTAILPLYCTTVVRLIKAKQLGPVWRDMFLRRPERLRLDQLPSIDAEPYHLEDCLGRRWAKPKKADG
ncbi:MAG: replication-relaxation family protein [Actinomycetota bacterium]|nr:replication-relaxation family protein [Actinomycetota bacterium]